MIKIIGVRFRTAGKIYFFDPLDFQVERGNHVIVETARGIEFGTVVGEPREVEDDKVIQPLKPVLRIANEKDIEQEAANKEKEKEAFKICLEKIKKHGLEMKLIDAEYTFDNNKVLFYFTADGRIDFRELVKDLASVFKTRIELRQIGVRDETKIVGGIGICGRPLCCHTHLSEFIPVSIKMAKEQNLSLNPTKISGVCGRLMCCLKHEEETYEELNRRLPGVGDYVTTADGLKGEVQSVNVLRQLVKVIVDVDDEKEIHEYKVDDLKFKRKHGKRERLELSQEELKELEKLEAEEQMESVEDSPAGKEERAPRRDNRQEHSGRRDNNRQGEFRRGDSNREDQQSESRDRNREERNGESRDRSREERNGESRDRSREERNGENRDRSREERSGENRDRNREERNRENRDRSREERNGENRDRVRGERQGENRDRAREGRDGENRQGENRQDRNRDRRGGRPERNEEQDGARQDYRGGRRNRNDGQYDNNNREERQGDTGNRGERQGGRRDNRYRNRQNYRGGNGKKEGTSNFEGSQSEGKGTT